MITSAIPSAARLSLAPARLAGRMAGSLLRGLFGNDSGDASSARSSARTTPASRGRARKQTKRTTTRSSAKARPKRTAARARPKGQPSAAGHKRTAARARPKSEPSAARSKRTAAGAGAQARPKRTAGREPLGDVAIAREVESTIFRNVDVDRGQVDVKVAEGVVRLQGEVRTPDLISELVARAVRVPQVRRVENLLHTPTPPPETATPASKQVDPASTLGENSPRPSPTSALRTRNLAASAREPGASEADGASGAAEPWARRPAAQAEAPTGAPEGAPEPAVERSVGDESADRDEAGLAELGKDPTYRPRDQRTHGLKGS